MNKPRPNTAFDSTIVRLGQAEGEIARLREQVQNLQIIIRQEEKARALLVSRGDFERERARATEAEKKLREILEITQKASNE